jgi:endonuclease YncB( thermonuclease family)
LENGPELEQQGKIGDAFYPAGKEAAEFLKQLIGDRVATMYVNADTDEYRRGDRTTGLCYVEETNLGYELIANGWAIADHSLMVPAELIARLNKRGLWRGEFVRPDRWRAGERLPGEVVAAHTPRPKPAAVPAETVHDQVTGSINHGGGDTVWRRVTGPVTVLDARTLEFSDGTRVELDLTIPNPDQMALNGDTLYPCAKEAAEFLRRLIGNRLVTCFQNDAGDGPWSGYVGNTNIERAMVVNGWALADHSSLHADEVIARENLRGLWRGMFLHPDDWLAGVRLEGEPAPERIADEHQAQTLLADYGHRPAALAALMPRIIRDVPDIRRLILPGGAFTDDHLTELLQLTSLEELNLDSCGGISMAGLASLQKLPHLKRLVLPYRSADAALESISGISTLETLAFYFAEATDAGLVHVKKLQNLRYLCLHRASVTDAGLAHLRELPSLAVLEFGGIPISDAGAVHLAACANLEYLDISDTEITDSGAAQLAGLTRLRVLKLPDRVTVDVRNRLQQALTALKFEGDPQDVLPAVEKD